MADQTGPSHDIIKKIKQIEIITRRLLSGSLIGDARSAIKGTGFEFDQIREYLPGDDVRFIDWNSSARANKLLVKQYVEERSRTIFLAVDISGSANFGSSERLKRERNAEIASILALVGEYGRDRVSLLLFSSEVELYIPPRQGKFHTRAIMSKLFGYKPKHKKTSIKSALKKISELKCKDSMVFIISDFIDNDLDSKYWPIVSRLADVVAIRCLDERERYFPVIGFVTVQDSEANETFLIDTRAKKSMQSFLSGYWDEQKKIIGKYGVELLDLHDNVSSIGELVRFFRRRMRY